MGLFNKKGKSEPVDTLADAVVDEGIDTSSENMTEEERIKLEAERELENVNMGKKSESDEFGEETSIVSDMEVIDGVSHSDAIATDTITKEDIMEKTGLDKDSFDILIKQMKQGDTIYSELPEEVTDLVAGYSTEKDFFQVAKLSSLESSVHYSVLKDTGILVPNKDKIVTEIFSPIRTEDLIGEIEKQIKKIQDELQARSPDPNKGLDISNNKVVSLSQAQIEAYTEHMEKLKNEITALRHGHSHIIATEVFNTYKGSSPEELNKHIEYINHKNLRTNVVMKPETGNHLSAGIYASLFGKKAEHALTGPRPLTPNELAITFPGVEKTILNTEGHFYGIESTTGKPVIKEYYEDTRGELAKLPAENGILSGETGSGKTFSWMINSEELLAKGTRFLVLDAESQFSGFAEGIGGQSIIFSPNKDLPINMLDIVPTLPPVPDNNDDVYDPRTLDNELIMDFKNHFFSINGFFRKIYDFANEDYTAEHANLFVHLNNFIYKDVFGFTEDVNSIYEGGSQFGERKLQPQISDYYTVASNIVELYDACSRYDNITDVDAKNEIENVIITLAEATGLANSLKKGANDVSKSYLELLDKENFSYSTVKSLKSVLYKFVKEEGVSKPYSLFDVQTDTNNRLFEWHNYPMTSLDIADFVKKASDDIELSGLVMDVIFNFCRIHFYNTHPEIKKSLVIDEFHYYINPANPFFETTYNVCNDAFRTIRKRNGNITIITQSLAEFAVSQDVRGQKYDFMELIGQTQIAFCARRKTNAGMGYTDGDILKSTFEAPDYIVNEINTLGTGENSEQFIFKGGEWTKVKVTASPAKIKLITDSIKQGVDKHADWEKKRRENK